MSTTTPNAAAATATTTVSTDVLSSVVPLEVVTSFDAKAVTAISNDKVEEVMTLLLDAAADSKFGDSIVAIKLEVEFQGFDVKETRKALAFAFAESYKDSDADKNNKAFVDDVFWMIIFFLVRGMASQKALNRSTNAAAVRYNSVAKKLAVVKSSSGLPPQAMTAARLCMALPLITIKISTIIGGKDFKGPMKSTILPACLKNPAFPSIIPVGNNTVRDLLAVLYTAYSFDQSYTFAKTKPKTAKFREIFEQQMVFTNLAIDGSLLTEAERVSVCKDLDIPQFISTCGLYLKAISKTFSVTEAPLMKNKDIKEFFKQTVTGTTKEKEELLKLAGIAKKARKAAAADESDEESSSDEGSSSGAGKKGKGKAESGANA